MKKHEEILKQIIGEKIVCATYRLEGSINNHIEIELENGKVLIFCAEDSEYSIKLNDANCEGGEKCAIKI